jgi:hypothetical protein
MNAIEIRLGFFKNSIFHVLRHLLQFSKRETHIYDISYTYASFPQLFAKGKSLKSVGKSMPQDKYKGEWAMPNQKRL